MYHIYTHCTIFLPIFTLTKKGKNAAKIYAANNVNDKGNKWKKEREENNNNIKKKMKRTRSSTRLHGGKM